MSKEAGSELEAVDVAAFSSTRLTAWAVCLCQEGPPRAAPLALQSRSEDSLELLALRRTNAERLCIA